MPNIVGQEAGDHPESRTLTFILRLVELTLTGLTCGLVFWMLVKNLPVPTGGETSAGHAAVFLLTAAFLGLGSAISGLIALCFKFDLLEALEPSSLRFGRLHYFPVYCGLLYLIVGTIGTWYAITRVRGGSQCSAHLSAFRGCGVLVAAIAMNCAALVATLVCSVKEHLRIRQWKV
ncbi:hypothetical protein VPNG_02874 [Cytospora leucostoma]|uniref:Uncharacterized protein n=1 Tax=Cytospora leucostoma TaxID=1230097 RepID=A0A423XJQ9_9PEZI|nr:hypothetical protein VPNG_02874 [Cytospora leucostoma]